MSQRVALLGFVVLLALPIGCGESDSSGGSNTGGKTGTGGTGGSSGKGGTGGSSVGGTGATGGSGGTGATGGSGGSGASGGTAGSGATGGSAGSTATGGSGGTAGASGGAAGAGGAAGGTGKTCGGKGGGQCDVGQYCHWADGSCGVADQIGECKIPASCSVTCSPVCGCDGEAYCNACIANVHGTDAITGKSCVPGNGGANVPCFVDGDCQTGFKCCRECGAIGCPQGCTKVATGGSCPAVP